MTKSRSVNLSYLIQWGSNPTEKTVFKFLLPLKHSVGPWWWWWWWWWWSSGQHAYLLVLVQVGIPLKPIIYSVIGLKRKKKRPRIYQFSGKMYGPKHRPIRGQNPNLMSEIKIVWHLFKALFHSNSLSCCWVLFCF